MTLYLNYCYTVNTVTTTNENSEGWLKQFRQNSTFTFFKKVVQNWTKNIFLSLNLFTTFYCHSNSYFLFTVFNMELDFVAEKMKFTVNRSYQKYNISQLRYQCVKQFYRSAEIAVVSLCLLREMRYDSFNRKKDYFFKSKLI